MMINLKVIDETFDKMSKKEIENSKGLKSKSHQI